LAAAGMGVVAAKAAASRIAGGVGVATGIALLLAGSGGLAEAACPACLAVAYLAEQPRELENLSHDQADAYPQEPPIRNAG
jgi:hypothetical protein